MCASGRSRKRSSESRLSTLFLCLSEGDPHQSPGASPSLRSWAGLAEDKSCNVDVDDELLPELVENPGTTRGTKLSLPELFEGIFPSVCACAFGAGEGFQKRDHDFAFITGPPASRCTFLSAHNHGRLHSNSAGLCHYLALCVGLTVH